jgi:hypothetical protein
MPDDSGAAGRSDPLAPGCTRGSRPQFWRRRGLLEEMIDGADQAHSLVAGHTAGGGGVRGVPPITGS